jgi:hypothetical protein
MAHGGDTMGEEATLALMEILYKTLRHLEEHDEGGHDDPGIQRLRHSILLTIAELELIKANRPAA